MDPKALNQSLSAPTLRRTTDPIRPRPIMPWGRVIVYGLSAGFLGVAAMTVSEKVEQFFTGRPNSYVPAKTLAALLGVTPQSDQQLWGLNMTMHYGQGAAAAVIRAVASYSLGMRGPFTDFMFMGVRLLIDQTLENWTGVGALPWTWPVDEQVVDLLHKGVFAFATGYLVDWWIQ
ncbi:uncharacterized protein QC763_000550 [Podospora pseudopauciseta]|uniref:DUF1440 domain-containing protein n=1 Tax=Podospora pseudopauciseta TaxID=2093780 RepID=A0ABR0HJQ1_9PEZI|nr:hypothetical protein QC763_000550 [Podospora pseudopauciseta]